MDETASGRRESLSRSMGPTFIARPLLAFRLSLDRSGWRVGPGWSVLLGAIAGGWHPGGTASYFSLVAIWLLADVAWGQLARVSTLDQSQSSAAAPARVALPYWRDSAPAARLARLLRAGSDADSAGLTGDVVRLAGFVVGLCLIVALSIALGAWAIVLSAVAAVCCALALLMRSRGTGPGLVAALFAAALPWSLGVLAFSRDGQLSFTIGRLTIGLAFSLVLWGDSVSANDPNRLARLLLGSTVAAAALVALRSPAGVAGMLLLLSPILVRALRGRSARLNGSNWEMNTPWTLAALAVAAAAVL